MAVRHGLCSPFIVLRQESPERFEELCDSYVKALEPENRLQGDLVFEAAACAWRLIRCTASAAALIEIEIERQRAEVDQKFTNPSDHYRIAFAIESLANNGRALALMHRYETRLSRAKQRALAELRKLKADPQPDDEIPGPPANTGADQLLELGAAPNPLSTTTPDQPSADPNSLSITTPDQPSGDPTL